MGRYCITIKMRSYYIIMIECHPKEDWKRICIENPHNHKDDITFSNQLTASLIIDELMLLAIGYRILLLIVNIFI
jgi:hypothetical protein